MKKTPSREAARVGPLAQSAADRVGPLADAAAERIQSAADMLSPFAHNAADRVAPYAQQAAAAVSPYAQQAADRLAPLAASVRERSASVVHEAAELLSPAFDEAYERVAPAVGAARDKVSDDLLPWLTQALAAAAASPLAVEAINRGRATLAAATGELVLPVEVEVKTRGTWLKRLAVVGALGGVAYVLARKFLGAKDTDWQAARPTTPYAPPKPSAPGSAPAASSAPEPAAGTPPIDATTEETVGGADESGLHDSAAPIDEPPTVGEDITATETFGQTELGEVPAEPYFEPVTEPVAEPTADPEAELVYVSETDSSIESDTPTQPLAAVDLGSVEPGTNDDLDLDVGSDVGSDSGSDSGSTLESLAKYSGPGVYVGSEPPEGFTIKGNERSMKYHLPESTGYLRTIAEVWFDSEDAAKEAGFIRAQR